MKAMKFPFRINPSGYVATINTTRERVQQAVIMAVGTRQEERMMMFGYGSLVPYEAFHNIGSTYGHSVTGIIETYVKDALAAYASYVKVEDVKVTQSLVLPSYYLIDVKYSYQAGLTETVQVNVSEDLLKGVL